LASSIWREVLHCTWEKSRVATMHPLLVSVSSLTWELNQAANIGDETDNAFRRTGVDGVCAARPISDQDIERVLEGRRLADSINEEPE
jgi:hypothetical protein